MKEIKVFKAEEVAVRSFAPHAFTQNEAFLSSIELLEALRTKSSKSWIWKMAKEEGFSWDEEKIDFAWKIINTMLDEINNGN